MSDILIIDDNQEINELIRVFFSDNQIEAVCASDGISAIEKLKSELGGGNPPMICLLDVILPELSGVDLMRKLRAVVPEIRFMLMTAYYDIPQIGQMTDEGIIEIFYKPFRMQELIAKVNFILANTKRIPVQ